MQDGAKSNGKKPTHHGSATDDQRKCFQYIPWKNPRSEGATLIRRSVRCEDNKSKLCAVVVVHVQSADARGMNRVVSIARLYDNYLVAITNLSAAWTHISG